MQIPKDTRLHKKRCPRCKHKALYYPKDEDNYLVKCGICGRQFFLTVTFYDDWGNATHSVGMHQP